MGSVGCVLVGVYLGLQIAGGFCEYRDFGLDLSGWFLCVMLVAVLYELFCCVLWFALKLVWVSWVAWLQLWVLLLGYVGKSTVWF